MTEFNRSCSTPNFRLAKAQDPGAGMWVAAPRLPLWGAYLPQGEVGRTRRRATGDAIKVNSSADTAVCSKIDSAKLDFLVSKSAPESRLEEARSRLHQFSSNTCAAKFELLMNRPKTQSNTRPKRRLTKRELDPTTRHNNTAQKTAQQIESSLSTRKIEKRSNEPLRSRSPHRQIHPRP